MSRNESEEREDFERWVLPEKYRTKGQPPPWFERHPNGDYINYAIRLQWDSWQARAALQSQDREAVKRPVLDGIVDEIHRRADKEWADNGYDFEVTISADEYRALCEEEKSIDHARRVEGDGE